MQSQGTEYEGMIEMAHKNLQLVEKFNKTKTGLPSLFVLDPLLTLVSALATGEATPKEIVEQIDRMELICMENGIPEGT